MTQNELLWTPPADIRERSRLGDFLHVLEHTRDLTFAGYEELWRWSVTDLAAFWQAVWDYFDVRTDAPPTQVLTDAALPGARWFLGSRLNYAEHVLRMPGLADDDLAVIAHSPRRAPVTLTAAQLREEVRLVRAGLRRLGVGAGHRVAAYAPNIPETYVLMLAAASIGATFTSCGPELDTRSVVDRWQQIEPTVLFAVDGDRHAEQLRAALPSLTDVITLSYLDPSAATPAGSVSWSALTQPTDEALEFDRLPFDHPLFVLHAAGTTGPPRPVIHGHGGILLEHLKALALQNDLGPGDRFFWSCPTSATTWHLLASAPAVGAAIVLVDGDPDHPDLGAPWRLAAETGTTYFGTSAPFLLDCLRAGIVPRQLADLSRLRAVGAAGTPLPAEGFRYVTAAVGASAHLHAIAGGTDVCTAFVGGSPLVPVRAGEISCRYLGAAVEAYDPAGRPVVGEPGQLVITQPMPSMPVGFWNDPSGDRYREAYFEVFPGVWRDGDSITIDADGSCVLR